MQTTIVKAPAKVNLYLDVINRRSDGYHNIETIFERIDLYDWIKISIIPTGIRLICGQGLPSGINNTAYKAVKLLTERYNLKCGFKIQIDKRIPIAAGLGGGSSDAAAVLLGVHNLLNIKGEKQALLKIAARIGADVPFFVSGYSRAFATGIGDKLLPLKQTQRMYFLLVAPDIRISASSVYRRLDNLKNRDYFSGLWFPRNGKKLKPFVNLALTKKRRNVNIIRYNLRHSVVNNINDILYNRLEEAILPSYPVLHSIKKALKKTGAEGILVSGSGSAVYGVFSGRKEAIKAESELMERRNWRLFLARNC